MINIKLNALLVQRKNVCEITADTSTQPGKLQTYYADLSNKPSQITQP
jgi:hypothetical protein